MFQAGDLIRIVEAPDQNRGMMRHFWGKLGIIVGKVNKDAGVTLNNIWAVFVDGNIFHFHRLDMEKINE